MTLLSLLGSLTNFVKDWGSSILKKCGYKVVKSEDFKEETLEVNFNYPTQSANCLNETENGAKFYWSEEYKPDYEKYFETTGNLRRYFKHGRQLLWIKKSKP